jgi:hypothetical protein
MFALVGPGIIISIVTVFALASCAKNKLSEHEVALYKSQISTQQEIALIEAQNELLNLQLGRLPASNGLSGSPSSVRGHFSRCLEDQMNKQIPFDSGMAFCKSAAR